MKHSKQSIYNKKNIDPKKNDKWYGYQEWYWNNGEIWVRGVMKNGDGFKYVERHTWKETIYNIR
jgi:hypothetical protein